MSRKIRPRYGTDPVQVVPPFSFDDTQIAQLFAPLPAMKGDRGETVAQLERCARDYLWRRNQHQQMPSRAEQNLRIGLQKFGHREPSRDQMERRWLQTLAQLGFR